MPSTIRTIHQQACTGGTIICRCVAALPTVAILSEISPLGGLHSPAKYFDPFDVLVKFIKSYPSARPDQDTMCRLFGGQLLQAEELARQAGLSLVARDHSHSAYMREWELIGARSAFLDACSPFQQIHSLITVRYPFSSYMSVKRNKWEGVIRDYKDYCCRYMRFLDHHENIKIFKYENFCIDPHSVLRDICYELDLRYSPSFDPAWKVQTITGNSGRMKDATQIQSLAFPHWSAENAEALLRNTPHKELCERLEYASDLTDYAISSNELAVDIADQEADALKYLTQILRAR